MNTEPDTIELLQKYADTHQDNDSIVIKCAIEELKAIAEELDWLKSLNDAHNESATFHAKVNKELCRMLGVDPLLAYRQNPDDFDHEAAIERVKAALETNNENT